MMIVPFLPEPIESLRARYPEATAEPLEMDLVMLGTLPRPGHRRRNVFDRADGLRLVVSRDHLSCGCVRLTVAARAMPGTDAEGTLSCSACLAEAAVAFFTQVSGDRQALHFGGSGPFLGVWLFRLLAPCREGAGASPEIEFTFGIGRASG